MHNPIVRFICLLLVFFSQSLYSQEGEDRTETPAPQFMLTTIPVRDILRDINIGYATQLDYRHSLEMRIGWVHPNNALHEKYTLILNSSEMRFQGPSVYFQMNRWRINKKGRNNYWGVIAGYRYMWYHDKQLHVYDRDGRSYDRDLVLSQWRNDIYLLGAIGIRTSKFSMTEISLGMRFMFTHSCVSTIRNGLITWTEEQNPSFVAATLAMVAYSEGFGMTPIIRITSRVGWVRW